MLVDDDKVDGEPLHVPVLVSAQQLSDLGDVLDFVDAKNDDRQITGNPESPQA